MSSRLLALCAVLFVPLSVGCSDDDIRLAQELTGGDVTRGKAAFRKYGCGSCHEVHGEQTAQGHAGPSFHDFAEQQYLPGGLINSPPTLVRWIRHPREVEPRTAMPELGVTERDAQDLAAYLYTQR
jgi:cytochrome c